MNWLLILAIALVVWLFLGQKENFLSTKNAHNMCHGMAAANCRIPTWQLNDCWLNAYQKCKGMCNKGDKGNLANCPCYLQASEMCRSNDDPAEACYSSTYQKCMAGRVAGFPDPDR